MSDDVLRDVAPEVIAAALTRARALESALVEYSEERDCARRAGLLLQIEVDAHTLKGATALHGLQELTTLTAGLQQIVARVRRGEVELDNQLVEILRRALSSVEASNESAAVPVVRLPADYTVRVIPYRDGVAIPLEDAQILWQR